MDEIAEAMISRLRGVIEADLISSEVVHRRFHPNLFGFHPSLLGFHRARHDFILYFYIPILYTNVYLETLTTTLVDYLEPKVKMESGKTYDLSDVDVVAFIEDFDKVIKAMRTEEDPNKETEVVSKIEEIKDPAKVMNKDL